ncbi:imidazole glycerol phosphate synthase subunit HisH [bacterium]|jgi:glutamine amidotransferase|nr:imidazole glycerol phosphate synthase subunit HisH [bacterium]
MNLTNIPKVKIIDYGIGNIWSVMSAFKYLGVEVEIVSDPEEISMSSILVLPGVGSFRKCMESLMNSGIDKAVIEAVSNKDAKILGVCLGMQLMGSCSTEDGKTKGLNLLPNRVEKFTSQELNSKKVPHVGFDSINFDKKEGLFKDLPDMPDFYFTHSYRMLVEDLHGVYATCKYGVEFLAAYQVNNICGTQFHPEKSQTNGLILLKNFIQL